MVLSHLFSDSKFQCDPLKLHKDFYLLFVQKRSPTETVDYQSVALVHVCFCFQMAQFSDCKFFEPRNCPIFWPQVNNVGTNIRKPTTDYSAEEYARLLSTNLESAYHLCQLAHPLLKASGNGSVVFISSVAGLVHLSSGSIYGATKGQLYYHSFELLNN